MEKHYEKPEAQVVRYQKRVKTNTAFTDSSGVQCLGTYCPYCNKVVFSIRADQYTTPGGLYDNFYDDFMAAAKAHANECPNWPEDFSYEDFSY